MEYTIKFDFSTVMNKKGGLKLRSGECDIATEATKEDLETSPDLEKFLAQEMVNKTKKSVASITNIEIIQTS